MERDPNFGCYESGVRSTPREGSVTVFTDHAENGTKFFSEI